MKPADPAEVSIFALGATLIRNRWRIGTWMLIGGTLAALSVLSRPRMYQASASFVPEGNEASQSRLVSLAGQIGINIPTGNQALSPDFYVNLLRSRVVLLPIARDTLTVAELGGRRVAVLDLFQIPSGPVERREERAIKQLQSITSPSVSKATGVVEVTVTSQWRSVSLAIAAGLLQGINAYNERTRLGRAISERKFVEGRLSLATKELQDAENRLAAFQKANRAFTNAPDLVLERERLQRDVDLRQQVFTTLMQSYEEARIREVRDTPVISIVEPPFAATLPKPRGLLIGTLLGLVVGSLVGILLSLTKGFFRRRRANGDADAEEFDLALREARAQLSGLVRRPRPRTAASTRAPG